LRNFMWFMPVVFFFPLCHLLSILRSMRRSIEIIYTVTNTTVTRCTSEVFNRVSRVYTNSKRINFRVSFVRVGLIFIAWLIDENVTSCTSVDFWNLLEVHIVGHICDNVLMNFYSRIKVINEWGVSQSPDRVFLNSGHCRQHSFFVTKKVFKFFLSFSFHRSDI